MAGIELALKDTTVISAIEKTGLRYANLKQQDYQKFLDAEEARLRLPRLHPRPERRGFTRKSNKNGRR
jgi:hypothetical protein